MIDKVRFFGTSGTFRPLHPALARIFNIYHGATSENCKFVDIRRLVVLGEAAVSAANELPPTVLRKRPSLGDDSA